MQRKEDPHVARLFLAIEKACKEGMGHACEVEDFWSMRVFDDIRTLAATVQRPPAMPAPRKTGAINGE